MNASADWPVTWLAFELLRRLPAYQAAWADYRANGSDDARPDGPDLQSEKWSAEFGLQHMLDPSVDAETHYNIPWRFGVAAVGVSVVDGAESFVFDEKRNPYWRRGWRRYVALRFDLGAPIEEQLYDARIWLTELAGKPASATRGRSKDHVLKSLAVLDLKAGGATNAELGKRFSNGATSGHADSGAKLVRRARKLCEKYREIAGGSDGARGWDN